METKWKVVITTVIITVPAFMLGAGTPLGQTFWQAVWPFEPPVAGEGPSDALVPLFMLMGLIEALSLGLAVSFLIFGRRFVTAAAGDHRGRAMFLYIAIAWVLGNWWVHDNLHIVNGENYAGLAVLEYAFHVTLIAAGAYLALNFKRIVAATSAGATTAPGTAATA